MSGSTPNLGLEYLDPSQAQPEVKINDAWNKLDASIGSVAVSDLTSPPIVARAHELVFTGDCTVTHETGGKAVVNVTGGTSGGGGSPLDVTDGTTDITDVMKIRFIGAAVSAASGSVADVTISGGSAFSGVSVRQSGDQTLASAAVTILAFDTEVYDTTGYHSNVTNNSRLTAPATGYYLVTAAVREGSAAATVYLILSVNGATVNTVSGADFAAGMSVAWEGHLASGDYVELSIFAASLTNTDHTATTFTMSYRGS